MTTTGFWVRVPRDAVRLEGPDAQTYLHSQVSQDLRPLQVGASTWAFLLQPAGKVDVLVRITRTADDAYVIDTDAGFGDVMTARLRRFKIRVNAELEPLTWTSIAVRGVQTEAAEVADALVVVGWGDGADLLGADPQPPAGVREGTADELLAARVEAAWPAMGAEIVPGETIPAETGVVAQAVSFTKGCYPGQELVERMDSRGASAPRLLRVIDVVDGTRPGDPVLRDGDEVGTVTSVAGRRAIASVKRTAVEA